PVLDRASYDRIVQNDYSVDGLVGGVTTVRYGITNRLLARRPLPGAQPGDTASGAAQGVAREILSVEIGQTYYSNELASRADAQYSSGLGRSVSPFSPLQITAISRPADGISTQFRTEIDAKHRAFRTITASGSYR